MSAKRERGAKAPPPSAAPVDTPAEGPQPEKPSVLAVDRTAQRLSTNVHRRTVYATTYGAVKPEDEPYKSRRRGYRSTYL